MGIFQAEGIKGEGEAGDMINRDGISYRERNDIINDLTDIILSHIHDIPHRTYFSHTSNSVYVYFYDRRLGILTIRDHGRCKNNRIRWMVQVGYSGRKRMYRKGRERLCYNEYKVWECLKDLRRVWEGWR